MSPRRPVPQKKKQSGLPSWVMVAAAAVIVVVVLAIGVDFVSKINTAPPQPTTVSTTGIVRVGRTEGDANAPISMVEFSDFQWPICREFATGAERQIEDTYVKNGKVKLTYKYFPVVDYPRTGESHWAAEAAECANRQGKFWEYHDKLFAVWQGENVGTYTKPKLEQYAAQIGLDAGQFNPCLEQDQTASQVQADAAEAQRMGASGTPTFFINNRMYQGSPYDYNEFARTFDSMLK